MVERASQQAEAASPSAAPRSSPSSSSTGTLAFLVHSPNTVEHNLPPEVDNKPLARQKRRRTSKEDEEILKAEYLRNPKPDKAARMEIVKRVALGEKEVQVWFQNKRQNDRRRCRPVSDSNSSPSDAAILSSSSLSSDPVSPDEDGRHEPHPERHRSSDEADAPDVEKEQDEAGDKHEHDSCETGSPSQHVEATPEKSDTQATETSTIPSTDPRTVDTAPTEPSSTQQSIPSSQESTKPRASYVADRRSASFPRLLEESPTTSTAAAADPSTRGLKRTHSVIRLATTAEGNARVITDADQSPSPPHKRPSPLNFKVGPALQRSYSAAGLNERLAAASPGEPSPKVPRTSMIGRSRDSRAWEFWCDPDSRNSVSLTTKAEQEGSGSAADAIGLIRANRRRSVLGQNHMRANVSLSTLQRRSESGTVKKARSFRRVETAQGRLQTQTPSKPNKKVDDSSSEELLPQTESDKENWEPETNISVSFAAPRRSRQQHPPAGSRPSPQRRRQILGENTEIMSQSASLGTMMARDLGIITKSGNGFTDPEGDDELMAFMNAAGSGEELGCVEGLLKLSRGG